jgi:Arc/MetJ-type ribon-helix-helix transcriptional regulator
LEYQALLAHAQSRVETRAYANAAELLRRALRTKREPDVERLMARLEGVVR